MRRRAVIAIAVLLVATRPLPLHAGDAMALDPGAAGYREAAGAPCPHPPDAPKEVDLGIPATAPIAPPAPLELAGRPGARSGAGKPRWSTKGVTIGPIVGLGAGYALGYASIDGVSGVSRKAGGAIGGIVGLLAGAVIGYLYDVGDAVAHGDPYLPVPPLPVYKEQRPDD